MIILKDEIYEKYLKGYGPHYQVLEQVAIQDDTVLAEIDLDTAHAGDHFGVIPGTHLLEAIQQAGAVLHRTKFGGEARPVTGGFDGVRIRREAKAGEYVVIEVKFARAGQKWPVFKATVYGPDASVIMTAEKILGAAGG